MGCGQVRTMILHLDGINTIHDLLLIPPQYGSNGLSYVPRGQTEQDRQIVPMGDIVMKLRQLNALFNITNLKYNGNQPIDYANVTAMMFLSTFRAFHFDPSFDYHHPSAEHIRNPAGPQLIPHRAGHSLVGQFRKTQKRARSDYPLLEKEDEEYVQWVEQVRSVAATHDTLEVLDPTYIPTTDEEIRLFELKNIFMFSVFDHLVKTCAGTTKTVRQFSSTMDRAVWGAHTYRYVQSPAAHIMTSQLHNKITTSTTTTTYPGSYDIFIDSFSRLLSDYDNLVTFEKHFTEDMKIVDLLHNTLGDIPELTLTGSQISISTHTSPVVLGFPEVVSLYKMNCAHLDKARKTTKAPCQINNAITSSSGGCQRQSP